MPLYEYRCRSCGSTFEQRRPMSESSAPATCPEGHPGALRLVSAFASVGVSSSSEGSPAAMPTGGGCGPACGCH